MSSRARLEARVTAANRANKKAMELYPLLRKALEPFVGKKVLTADGNLTAAVEKALPPLPNTVHRHRATHTDYTLSWVVTECENVKDEHGCHYEKANVNVAELSGQVLKLLCEPVVLRCDYSADEFEALRAAYRVARDLADEAKSKLYPFDEYDR